MKKKLLIVITLAFLVLNGSLLAVSSNILDFSENMTISSTTNIQIGGDMVNIPSGEFGMGDHIGDGDNDPNHPNDELPIHPVRLDSFSIGVNEVTNQEYCTYLNAALNLDIIEVKDGFVYVKGRDDILCETLVAVSYSHIEWNGNRFTVMGDKENHPMIGIRWYGAATYCNWLSSQHGYPELYNTSTWTCDFLHDGYRLPTEAEWEYAARGGEYDPYYNFPWGNDPNNTKANWPDSGDPYEIGSQPWTTPVGFYNGLKHEKNDFNWPASMNSYQTSDGANGYGLYDVAGNVWEWCNDWYDKDYYQYCVDHGIVHNPQGPETGGLMPDGNPYHVLRGGNWYNGEYGHSRVSNRNNGYYRGPDDPNHAWYHIGFRVVIKGDNRENHPPQKPDKPTGLNLGNISTEYTYSSMTSDPDGDQVYYLFDWGDGTDSGWVGPYDSGLTVSISHTWGMKGNYEIKVKAKDIFNMQSNWSDPLMIVMAKSASQINKISPQTVGLFINDAQAYPGYTLFAPKHHTSTYLINNEGLLCHSWKNSRYDPGQSVHLLENGHLLRACFLKSGMTGGGEGGRIEEYDWDDNLVWDFNYSTDNYMSHHDIQPLSNGNILVLAVEKKTIAECVAAGFNPSYFNQEIQKNGLYPDYVIEVEPTGTSGGNIVWEWHVWDHLIQDYDSSKNNYGDVSSHSELIDANGLGSSIHYFWNHMNSIDYNEDLDQIILSVRGNSEIWIIDHSTTTEEAADHTGGTSGKGGDLLYRWGNPQTYDAGSSTDQMLFEQHDAQWIEEGCPGEGNILIFNNGVQRLYSSVDEIEPPLNSNKTYDLVGSVYGPKDLTWTYTASPPSELYSEAISGAQRLPNENTLICDGVHGTFLEVTANKEIVWLYVNPVINTGPLHQGDEIPLDIKRHQYNAVFKIHRYTADYPGLAGRDLTPGEPIELYDNENQAPNTPNRPDGTTSGKPGILYSYETAAVDPDGDNIYYWFDWGDESNSGWLGPYASGISVNATHSWETKGNYQIKVKAKDARGLESDWSTSLPISMPKNTVLNLFFQRFPYFLPLVVGSISNLKFFAELCRINHSE